MPAAWLPYVGLGLSGLQMLQGEKRAGEAVAEAKKPRLSAEQQGTLRKAGTSNIGANLASRGLLDSSLYGGALADLEGKIGEASAGTMGDVSGLLSRQAEGLSAGGAQGISNIAQLYMLQKLFGQNKQQPEWGSLDPWTTYGSRGSSRNQPIWPYGFR